MKKIWITSLVSSEEAVKNVMGKLKTYGFDVSGHFWEDDLEKMAWSKVRQELIDSKAALWLILTSSEDLLAPSLRYGLSLLTITVQARLGLAFPITILLTEGQPPPGESLPTPIKGADFFSVNDAGFGAKLVAKVHGRVVETTSEYRLDTYGNPQIGQWLEVGPRSSPWDGAMLGVAGGEITFHAVGPKESLPSQSVLNYPLKGLKLNLRETEYTAWAVKNKLEPQSSYFVKVEGFPGSIIFGSYSQEQEPEVFVVHLK